MSRIHRIPTLLPTAAYLAATAAQAQEPASSPETVTTVAPVTVTALVPIPEVGTGATWFAAEDIRELGQQARMDEIDARAATRQCRERGPPESEEFGDFSFEALYDTEARAQGLVHQTAATAAAAIEASIEARRAAARGEPADVEGTELSRQRAIQNFQSAQAGVHEARRRIADLQDFLETDPGGPEDVRPQVEARTIERAGSTLPGGLYKPGIFRDLKLENIVVYQVQEGPDPAMRVSGVIVNPRRSAVTVPPLWVAALDRYGTVLKDQQMEPPVTAPRIAAGGRAAFTFSISPLPERAERAVVTFAPFHREPELKPVSAFCEV